MNDDILICFPPALRSAVDAALVAYPDACIYSVDVRGPIVRADVLLRYFVEGVSPIELTTDPPVILTLYNPEHVQPYEPDPLDYCY